MLELLPASKLSFKLGLPKPGGTAVAFTERGRAAYHDQVAAFGRASDRGLQAVFEGIFSSSSLIFQGQIEVTSANGFDSAYPLRGPDE